MAATSGKIIQNVPVSQCCVQYHNYRFALSTRNLLPLKGGKFARTNIQTSYVNRGTIYCNAAPSVPLHEKVDFRKLQNGSDIRGVAIGGVEGEALSLTELVTEAIAAAFAAWLSDKKKADGSKPLSISVGHDSRISAKKLQDAVSRGIAGAGLNVIQYGLASTPAMFNSTITEDGNFLCPVDGSIMITGELIN